MIDFATLGVTDTTAQKPDAYQLKIGVDLKDTPDLQMGVIEINGLNSGITGLKELIGMREYKSRRSEAMEQAVQELFACSETIRAKYCEVLGAMYDFHRGVPMGLYEELCSENRVMHFLEEQRTAIYNNHLESAFSIKETQEAVRTIVDGNPQEFPLEEWFHSELFDFLVSEGPLSLKPLLLYQKLSTGSKVQAVAKVLSDIYGVEWCGNDLELGPLCIFSETTLLTNHFKRKRETLQKVLKKFCEEVHILESPVQCVLDDQDLFERYYKKRPYLLMLENHTISGMFSPQRVKFQEFERLFPVNGLPLETDLRSKILHKKYVPEQHLAPWMVYTGNVAEVIHFCENLETLKHPLVSPQMPYVVVKPENGAHGNGVRIYSTQDLISLLEDLISSPNKQVVIEAFVPSKAFYNAEKEGQFDGCMRYLWEGFYIPATKQLIRGYADAYWRVSKSAEQDDCAIEKKYITNLTSPHGASTHLASAEEISRATDVVEQVVKNIVESL